MEDINGAAIVGTKQVLKAVVAETLRCVYLAEDVDAFLAHKIKTACYEHGIEVRPVPTMQELGTSCGIDVGAACAGVPAKE